VELFGAANGQLEVGGRVANCEWGHTEWVLPRGIAPRRAGARQQERRTARAAR
jgi:hypothetical protein